MYDMYPDSWADREVRPVETASAPVRRHVRREHRILPVVVEPVTRVGADPVVRPDRTA